MNEKFNSSHHEMLADPETGKIKLKSPLSRLDWLKTHNGSWKTLWRRFFHPFINDLFLPQPMICHFCEVPGKGYHNYMWLYGKNETYWAFFYTLDGKGIYWDGEKEYEIGPNQAFFAKAQADNEAFYYSIHSTEPWRFIDITFSGKSVDYLIPELRKKYGPVFSIPRDKKIITELLSLETSYIHLSNLTHFEGSAWIWKILAACEESQTERKNNAIQIPKNIQLAKELIEKRWFTPIQIQQLAQELHISREHLSRKWVEVFNHSPQEYLTSLRITQTKTLLSNSTLSFKEIAKKCGFGSYTSLKKAFNKLEGVSLKEYRAG